LDSGGYLLIGVLWVIFGTVAFVRRKGAVERSRSIWRLLRGLGIRPAPDRVYELTVAWGSVAAITAGLGAIIAGLVMLATR
jgi:hypothetical protein